MKERRKSQDASNAATAPPITAQAALQQQAGKFWLPQAGTDPGALQPQTMTVDASSGDAAALAQSQALYQQHLRLLLLQTLQWNNCATSDCAASAGVSGTTTWPNVRPLSAFSQFHRHGHAPLSSNRSCCFAAAIHWMHEVVMYVRLIMMCSCVELLQQRSCADVAGCRLRRRLL